MYRDEFTFSMMRAMLEILNASRVPFVLMTATMPQSLENSLFENIKIDKDNKIVINKFGLDNAINISLGQEPIYENSEVNITSQLLEEIQAKKTLLVLNQVKRAQKVYEEIKDRLELKEGAEIILLHSRFTREDRRIHEDEAIKTLPHKKDGRLVIPDGVGIVVTTQVLEAGIDFSAELLLTELAPADSLVQRAGRCARYRDEKGKMVIFPVENEKGHLPYEKPYLEKTWQWLEKHTDFNIKDFSSVSDFVNILDYKADDFAARDSLIDLYEAVLYADTKPENIQIREGKSVNLVVVDFGLGVGKKKKNEMILEAIKKTNIKEHSLSVDFRFAWGIKDKLKCELNYDIKEEKWKIKDIKTQISPFKTYIIENNDYDSKIGVKYDEFTAF
jgi:CRISPR-associated endonuclease/helicase Cas3